MVYKRFLKKRANLRPNDSQRLLLLGLVTSLTLATQSRRNAATLLCGSGRKVQRWASKSGLGHRKEPSRAQSGQGVGRISSSNQSLDRRPLHDSVREKAIVVVDGFLSRLLTILVSRHANGLKRCCTREKGYSFSGLTRLWRQS